MKNSRATLGTYIIGFVLSIVLTITAYSLVEIHITSSHKTFSHEFLYIAVTALALIQFLVQIIFFLHLGKERESRINVFIFGTTVVGICILVFGSLWIMNHLNNNMSPADMNSLIMHNEGMQY